MDRSRTQALLKNAMRNHAGPASPVYDWEPCIDLIEMKVDRGNDLEKADIYKLPDRFAILSWTLEGNSSGNPLLFGPETIYPSGRFGGDSFLMFRKGWFLYFRLQ